MLFMSINISNIITIINVISAIIIAIVMNMLMKNSTVGEFATATRTTRQGVKTGLPTS